MSPEQETEPDKEQEEPEEELDFEIKLGTRRDAASDDEGEEADEEDAHGSEEGEGFVTGGVRGLPRSELFSSVFACCCCSLPPLQVQLVCMCIALPLPCVFAGFPLTESLVLPVSAQVSTRK